MIFNIKELTVHLEIGDHGLSDLKKQIVRSFDDEKKMRDLLSQQCLNREGTHCLLCDNEGDCFILNGIIYLSLNETEKAINELEKANRHLRSKDEVWNSISGSILLGIAYEKFQKSHQALSEYKRAHEILTRNYQRIHGNDYIEKARLLENKLRNKLKQLSSQNLSTAAHTQTNSAHTNSNQPGGNDDTSYLALFSIPIYGTVEAGEDGSLHIDHFDTFTIVNKVELQEQVFNIYGVHGTASTDRQITVMTTRTHGWLRVHGMSMNGWDIPFDENDYVLFYKASAASHLDYVIASNRDPSGEIALIVKRFDEKNNQLLSRSKDTSNPYNPIPLDENHQIFGVVIAVAKPAQ